jgi:hypothetical protein
MDKPEQKPSGQVVQENLMTEGQESAPPHANTGPKLALGFTVGKDGKVEKKGMVQSSSTNVIPEG